MAWDAGTRADALVTARAVCSWYFQVCSFWFIHLDFDTAAWSGQFSVAAVPYPRPGNLYRKGLSWLVIVEAGKSRIRRLSREKLVLLPSILEQEKGKREAGTRPFSPGESLTAC